MDKKMLIAALWSIHSMFEDLNIGNTIDAQDLDLLEEEITKLEGSM